MEGAVNKVGPKKRRRIFYHSEFFPSILTKKVARKALRSRGSILILAVLFITIGLLFLDLGLEYLGFFATLRKVFAFLAISLLSLSYFLSSRSLMLDNFYDGIDKAYSLHHLIGRLSFLFMLLHAVFVFIDVYPDRRMLSLYFWPGSNWYYTSGLLALLTVAVLLFVTLSVYLPYNLWIYTHRAMILALPLALYHSINIGENMISNQLLRTWIIILVAVGIVSYIYKVFLYAKIGPRHDATVIDITPKSNIYEIKLRLKRGLPKIRPGQFFFISFKHPNVSGESHPFTISGIDDKGVLRLSIKDSGDFTGREISKVGKGTKAMLYGPYGKFYKRALENEVEMIWIAGGIGITPFLSMLQYVKKTSTQKKIYFIWSIRYFEEAAYDEEIRLIVHDGGPIAYKLWQTSDSMKLTAKKLAEIFKIDVKDKLIFICGPKEMMYDLSNQFIGMDVPVNNIVIEEFQLK